MFGVGILEIILIAGVVVLFYGPDKLPTFMQEAGKLFVHLRRISNEVKGAMDSVIAQAEKEINLEEALAKKKESIVVATETTQSLPRPDLVIEVPEKKLEVSNALVLESSKAPDPDHRQSPFYSQELS